MLTPQAIAKALGVPVARIAAVWPALDAALAEVAAGQMSDRVRIAALATVRIECPSFLPQREEGAAARFVSLYWENERVRAMLGNRTMQDATTYCGRGLIQLTGYDNYLRFGTALCLDLEGDPDLALVPENSVRIFAHFFHKCILAANALQFTRVRELVNGGHNQLKPFLLYVQMLATAAPMPEAARAAAAQLAAAKASANPVSTNPA